MRWALPDRVFFACGACHILASAFLERYGTNDTKVLWLKPNANHASNHIVIATETWIFDYHGYSGREAYFGHTIAKARRWWPSWSMNMIELPPAVLLSEEASRTYDGLWLREPKQFLQDAMPRARSFLDRFSSPPYVSEWARSCTR